MEITICSRFSHGGFREPSGAVPTHSTIVFEIQVPRHYGLKETSLVWITDENGEYQYIKMRWKGMNGGRDIYEQQVEVKTPGLVWYYFQLKALSHVLYVGKGIDRHMVTEVEPPSWQLTIYDENFTTPDWIKGGIYYHIFVDRFAKEGPVSVREGQIMRHDWGGLPEYAPNEHGEVVNNDFFGGNLKGIISKLPYLESLGVTCIYLSPIFEAYSNHKYDTGDYKKIDPTFGDLQDFQDLCEAAMRRGIRIILDGVFNHTGSDSKYFNKKATYPSVGAYQSKESPYYDWYKFIRYPNQYECWWGIDTLPAINEENPSYEEFIAGKVGIASRWLLEGAAGWRLDVVDELPDQFLEKFRRTVKGADPEALIIGEVWEDASSKIAYGKRRHYFHGQQLDSVMNYPFKDAIIQFIRYRDSKHIHHIVTSIVDNYPSNVVHCLMNMLGTHDTRRILTALGGKEMYHANKEAKSRTQMTEEERIHGLELLKLAVLLQMTLPGVPCIYYGDEAGMEGYEDPFNRRCYPWGKEEQHLLRWYKKIANIREKMSVFKDGSYETIHSDDSVYIFQRINEKEKVVIGINRSDKLFRLEVGRKYEDLLHKEKVGTEYIIEPNEACLLVHKVKQS